MSKVTFELNYAGVGEVLTSAEMQDVMNQYAQAAVGRLPQGYAWRESASNQRAAASVYTETYDAMKDNSKNNSLLKAVMGGNG